MSVIQDCDLMKEAVASCHYFWEAGWGECHAGNMSYLLHVSSPRDDVIQAGCPPRADGLLRLRDGHDEAYAISHELISAFRESLGTAEKPPKHTIDFLTVHLRAAISRSKTGIRIQNELTQQVKISIPLIYEFTNKKMSEIEARHGISFDENEIAYIAIYLSTVFQESEAEDISLRILFICSFGIATSTVLKSKIAKMLLGEKLIGPMSREKAREFLKHGEVGDAGVEIDGMRQKVSPTSTVIGATMLNAIVAALVQRFVEAGVSDPPVFYSANLDGGDELNRKMYERYKEHIKFRL